MIALDCRSSGTTARFLLGYCAMTPGLWFLYGTPQLQSRPMADAFTAARAVGAGVWEANPGRLPVLIRGACPEAKEA